ncbi:hypothetical protein D6D22_08776 [Aureobasidium pullulans]|uniref:Uncharacterized protein n=1 Tax=Aureobasidium pullulans TaxID=5580 RepID=A0A4V4IGA0_AURPU|nr:hypothetical protein D6D22_08776 [Aureobasidium pullulans]THW57536.1 hypothetical protein D6D20_07892 [Aureobasidium pullulans]
MDDKLLEPILVRALKRIENLENEHAKNDTERKAAQRAWDHSYIRQDEMEVELASLKNKIHASGETQNGESQALRRICETQQRTIQQQQTSLAKMQVEIDALKQYPRRVDDLDSTTLDLIDELDAQREMSKAERDIRIELETSIVSLKSATDQILAHIRAHVQLTGSILDRTTSTGIPLRLAILYKANLEALTLTSPILTTQNPKQSTDVVYDAGGTYQTAPHRIWVEQGILYTNGHHGVNVASGDLLLESWDQQVTDWTARYKEWEKLNVPYQCISSLLAKELTGVPIPTTMPAFACKKCQRERKLCVAYDATKKHLRLLPLEHEASGDIGLITRSAFIRPLLKLKVRQQQPDGALEDNYDSTDHSENVQRPGFDEGYKNSHFDRFSNSHGTSLAYQSADVGNGDNEADAMLLDL